MTNEALNRWVAEKLEPNPKFNHCDISKGSCWMYVVGCYLNGGFKPRDFCSDPSAWAMLLEQLIMSSQEDFTLGQCRDTPDNRQLFFVDSGDIDTTGESLGRAIVMYWAKVHGYKEDEWI